MAVCHADPLSTSHPDAGPTTIVSILLRSTQRCPMLPPTSTTVKAASTLPPLGTCTSSDCNLADKQQAPSTQQAVLLPSQQLSTCCCCNLRGVSDSSCRYSHHAAAVQRLHAHMAHATACTYHAPSQGSSGTMCNRACRQCGKLDGCNDKTYHKDTQLWRDYTR